MSQNFNASVARAAAGGASLLSLDKSGNLQVIQANTNNQILVPAGTAKTVLGATGAVGDELVSVTIVPATTSPGSVTIYDGTAGTALVLFNGGATSVADLKPFQVTINSKALAAGWFIATGANVSAIVIGNFT